MRFKITEKIMADIFKALVKAFLDKIYGKKMTFNDHVILRTLIKEGYIEKA